jgi:hypothetical protein
MRPPKQDSQGGVPVPAPVGVCECWPATRPVSPLDGTA